MSSFSVAPEHLQRWLQDSAKPRQPNPHAPLLVDVRRQRQFHQQRIAGSHNIPAALLLSGEPLDRDLILIAAEPGEAEALADALHANGFHRRIQHLEGGLPAWRNAGLPVENVHTAATADTPGPRSLQRPLLLGLALLGLALAIQQVQPSLILVAVLLWTAMGALSVGLHRSGRQLLRRSA